MSETQAAFLSQRRWQFWWMWNQFQARPSPCVSVGFQQYRRDDLITLTSPKKLHLSRRWELNTDIHQITLHDLSWLELMKNYMKSCYTFLARWELLFFSLSQGTIGGEVLTIIGNTRACQGCACDQTCCLMFEATSVCFEHAAAETERNLHPDEVFLRPETSWSSTQLGHRLAGMRPSWCGRILQGRMRSPRLLHPGLAEIRVPCAVQIFHPLADEIRFIFWQLFGS